MKPLWLLCGLVWCMPVAAPAQKAPEVVHAETPDQKAALAQMNSLLVVLNDPTKNIFRDQVQKDLLTPDLLQLVLDAGARQVACAQRHPNEPVTEADSAIFLHAWDLPTEIKITKLTAEGNKIDFVTLFKWGPETNYPGDSREAVFTFKKVGEAWKLDDIFHPGSPEREEVRVSTFLKETWHD